MIHEEQYKEQYKRYKTTANTEKEYKLPHVPWWGQEEVDTEKPGYYSISYNRGALRGGEIRVHFTNDEAGIRKHKHTIPVERLPYLIQLAIENGEAPQFESLLDELERLRGEVEKYKKLAEDNADCFWCQ